MTRRCVIGASLLLTAGSPVAMGDMIYTAQQRYVRADANAQGPAGHSMQNALDFGPFAAQVEALSSNGPTRPPNLGRASQSSTLEPRQITMSGSIYGEVHHVLIGSAWGTSSLTATFTIGSPELYALRVRTTGFTNPDLTLWHFHLTGPSGTVFTHGGRHQPPSYELFGVLPPGTYTFQTYWTTGLDPFGPVSGGGILGTYDVRFMIPAPATVAVLGFACLLARRGRRALA